MAELTEETKKLGLEKLKEVRQVSEKALDETLDTVKTALKTEEQWLEMIDYFTKYLSRLQRQVENTTEYCNLEYVLSEKISEQTKQELSSSWEAYKKMMEEILMSDDLVENEARILIDNFNFFVQAKHFSRTVKFASGKTYFKNI